MQHKVIAESLLRMECQALRDFCSSATLIMDQSDRFLQTKTVSYPVLRDIIGEPINRGPLWCLKDTVHILFANKKNFWQTSTFTANVFGLLLDQVIGSVFHESIKLMESAYQTQHYTFVCKTMEQTRAGFLGEPFDFSRLALFFEKQNMNMLSQSRDKLSSFSSLSLEQELSEENALRFLRESQDFQGVQDKQLLKNSKLSQEEFSLILDELCKKLNKTLEHSADDVERGVARIKEFLDIVRPLFCYCYQGKGSNVMLKKFLADKPELIKRVFGTYFDEFIEHINFLQG